MQNLYNSFIKLFHTISIPSFTRATFNVCSGVGTLLADPHRARFAI